ADNASNDRSLTLTAGTAGAVVLGGTVGGNQPLNPLTVTNAGTASLRSVFTTRGGGISVAAGGITLNGGLTTGVNGNAGAVTLTGPVTLGANVTVTTDAAVTDANISIAGTVNADLAANNRTLTLLSGTGSFTVTGAIGGLQPIQTLTATNVASGISAGSFGAITTRSGGITISTISGLGVTLSGNLDTTSTGTAGSINLVGATIL